MDCKEYKSKAVMKADIVGMIIGLLLMCVGGIMYLCSDDFESAKAGIYVLVSGGYFLLSCGWYFLVDGVVVLRGNKEYICFTDTALSIYSENPKKCYQIPLSSIVKIRKVRNAKVDLIGSVVSLAAKLGYVMVEYVDQSGKRKKVSFGPINNCKNFVQSISVKIGK